MLNHDNCFPITMCCLCALCALCQAHRSLCSALLWHWIAHICWEHMVYIVQTHLSISSVLSTTQHLCTLFSKTSILRSTIRPTDGCSCLKIGYIINTSLWKNKRLPCTFCHTECDLRAAAAIVICLLLFGRLKIFSRFILSLVLYNLSKSVDGARHKRFPR